jgi:DNA-binding response OmpR family regulator
MARILLLDDNQALRILLRQCLVEAGHDVVDAGDGEAGGRLYRLQSPDLVICDLYMPGKDGLEFIREVGRKAGTRIIAISGEGLVGFGSLLPVAQAFGADLALQKPFDYATLLRAVETALAMNASGPASDERSS